MNLTLCAMLIFGTSIEKAIEVCGPPTLVRPLPLGEVALHYGSGFMFFDRDGKLFSKTTVMLNNAPRMK